jgi:guanylate kinase
MGNKLGKIIVIVGPSGAGKSTLMKKIRSSFPELEESISCTTRSIRDGEKEGVNYFYLTKNEFLKRKDRGDFLEWATVHSNLYGTSKEFVKKKMDSGISLLFDIDIQGADSIKEYFGDRSHIIFIAPPNLEELKERLLSRGTDSLDVIKERLQNAKGELLRKNDYNYLVENDGLDKAYAQLKGIIKEVVDS